MAEAYVFSYLALSPRGREICEAASLQYADRPCDVFEGGDFLFTRSIRMRGKNFVIIVTGLSSFWIVESHLAQEHPAVAVLSSLLSGFAPIIGLFVLLSIISLLISCLVCSVERTLGDEDDGIVPEPHLKSKWHHVAPSLPDMLARCLSLKEHSPPAFSFSNHIVGF